MPRTIIKGGIIVTATATYRADLLLEDEQIGGVVKELPPIIARHLVELSM